MRSANISPSDNRLVWYAVYGSNLRRQRFDCYIAGGRPEGSNTEYPGCRDKTPPKDDRPIALTHAFSSSLLNTFKFGFNRGTTYTQYLNPTGQLYAISVAGLTSSNNGRVIPVSINPGQMALILTPVPES